MTLSLTPAPVFQFFYNGQPAVGYKLFTYAAGTTTKLPTFTTFAGNSANTNPIVLDSQGIATIWLTGGVYYKFELCPPNDSDPPASPIYTTDSIAGLATAYEQAVAIYLVNNTTQLASNQINSIIACGNGSFSSYTVNLPSAANAGDAYTITITKSDSATGTVTISSPDSANLGDLGTRLTLTNLGDSVTFCYSLFLSRWVITSACSPQSKWVLNTANPLFPNAQSLAALSTGYAKVTTTTGIVSTQVIPIPVTDGGTQVTSTTAYGVVTGGTTSTSSFQNAGTGLTSTILQGAGSAALPTWSTATYPATTTINQVLYSSAANTVTGLSTATDGTLVTDNSGVPSILAGPGTTGAVLRSTAAAAPTWSSALYPASTTLNQILYSSSANNITGLATAVNGVLITDGTTGIPSISSTIPSATQLNITQVGTLTSGAWHATLVGLAFGGTNANLTASIGGLVYSTASALAILSGTATANQIPLSGSSAAPSWSSATYPSTVTASNLLYSNGANTVQGLATANNGVLVTSATGVPSISTTVPQATQNNFTVKDFVSYTYFGGL